MAEEGERMIAESIEQARPQLPQAPTGDDGFPDDDEFTDSSDDNFPVAQMSTDPTYTTSVQTQVAAEAPMNRILTQAISNLE